MTNNLNNKKNGSPLASIIVVVALVAAAVAFIVFLKRATVRSLDADGFLRTSADSCIAHPDLDAENSETAGLAPALPDTVMGTDARDVADAGYEDGYWAGYDDAHLGEERASYDESCTFTTQAERQKYAANYREGYAEGWQTGIADREAADRADEQTKMPRP